MPGSVPDGDVAPLTGELPAAALDAARGAAWGVYVHVPFCTVRCGYCDFNTYTASELGTTPGASQATYAEAACAELDLAARVLPGMAPVDTVFFGGGTPTLLPSADLVSIVRRIQERWGLADDAEVTTEANPDSVSAASLRELRDGGFTRVSFGMQSAVTSVLATLDRTHDPERVPQAVQWAREAGFEQISLDLIYGTPGESLADWETSLNAALACAPDHVSAYSLIVEDGTAMARQVKRGVLPAPDDDDLADKYLLADELLTHAGLSWYEVSNWARTEAAQCRHNLGYWRGRPWWGVGPGAHSHVGGVRWWNVRHPAPYADRIAARHSPAQARETLGVEARRMEETLLETRLSDGFPAHWASAEVAADLQARNLITPAGQRFVLTQQGRLLADAVVRDLLD